MSGLTLLIIGLLSLALILAATAWCGLRAWHTYKLAMAVYDHVGPLADQLSGWSMVAEAKAMQLQQNSDQIAANLARLQASLTRLQLVADHLVKSTKDLRRAAHYLGIGLRI